MKEKVRNIITLIIIAIMVYLWAKVEILRQSAITQNEILQTTLLIIRQHEIKIDSLIKK